MDMIKVKDIKSGDVIRFDCTLNVPMYTTGSTYNVLYNDEFGKHILADDGNAQPIVNLAPYHWTKVEPKVEQPKTINLSLLKEQISIISDKYDEDYHLDLLINFIDGYERGLNKWKRTDILHLIKITARIN